MTFSIVQKEGLLLSSNREIHRDLIRNPEHFPLLLPIMSTATEPPFYEDAPLALLSSPAFLTGKVGLISGFRNKTIANL
jgi:hypothetical protein